MQDFSFDVVARKSVRGIFALISRTFLIQVLSVITSFILTVFLDPSSFGVFFVVSSIVVFLNYFQDIGLAASLIQKKEEPTKNELQTTFTIQMILVSMVIIPSLVFSGGIASFYKLNQDGYYLLIALLISFFLSSLRTIPTVLLERNLLFHKLVIPQIVENFIYNITLIVLVLSGFGITTFTIAVLLRSIFGLFTTYLIQSWEIGFSFHRDSFRKLIHFGLPFQLNSILALIKDDLLTLYLGRVLPYAQVGFIGFSQKWAFMPLRLIMDNVIKITFPTFSRLQHDRESLKVAIEKSLFLISLFIFPIATIMILLSSYFVSFFPRYQKWEPAIVSLVFFCLNSVFSSISTPLTNFLNSIGKVKTTLSFMLFWTVATWILTPLFITLYGYNGVAFASFIISISSIAVLFVVRSHVKFSIVHPILTQLIASIGMAGFIILTKNMVETLPLLFLEVFFSGCVYMILIYLLERNNLVKTFKFVFQAIKSSS